MKIFIGLFVSFALSSCGQSGSITIQSDASSTALHEPLLSLSPINNLSSGQTFKLCIRSIKFEEENGEAQEKEGENEIKFKVGLIDLTQNDVQKITWEKIEELPVGYKLKKIKIKIHKDPTLCGVNYSIKYDTYEFDKDMEFQFKVDEAFQVEDGAVLNLKLSQFVSTIAANAPSGADATKAALEALENKCGKGN